MSLRKRIRRALFLLALALFVVAQYAEHASTRAQQPSQQQTQPTPTPTPATTRATPARQAAPSSSQQDADDDVVRVETDLTNILMTAIDRNRNFVTTLRQEDIRVLENNVPQPISIFDRQTNLPLSLAILIDLSDSQAGVLSDEQAAANAFIDTVLRPGKDQAAVVSFTGLVRNEQPLTDDKASLHAAIDGVKIPFGRNSPECDPENETATEQQKLMCSTAVWDAIWGTTDKILSQTPERTRRAVILLSDGDDTVSETKRQEAIDFAVKHNTAIYSIGIRDKHLDYGKLDRDALRKASEQTGGRVFFPTTREELNAAFAQIEQELRSQYLVSYAPTNKTKDGSFRQVKIEVVNPQLRKDKLRLLYREGYYARKR